MKKKIIIGVIVFLVLLIGVGSYFIFFNKDDDKKTTNNKSEKITITFDADGGSKVEDITIKKGSSFELPETTKEGYTFAGWYNGTTLYTDDDTASIKKNIVLTAKWEEKEPDVKEEKTLKVTFDSKGGSKVKDLTFKCSDDGSATIKGLPKSKKDSYNFMSWEDKHGKSILDGAKITCEGKETTLKLYAVWEYDGPVANPEQNLITKEPIASCPSGAREDGDKCVTLSDYNKGDRTCPKVFIEGHDYQGTKVEAGTTFCLYAVYEAIKDQTTCEKTPNGLSRTNEKEKNYGWYNGKCYKAKLQNYETTCGSGYSYYTSADILNKFGGHNNGGCYKTQPKTLSCESGFELKDSKCVQKN